MSSDLKLEIQKLQQELDHEEDFGKKMEIRDKIHNLKMTIDGIRPQSSEIDCVGCGS